MHLKISRVLRISACYLISAITAVAMTSGSYAAPLDKIRFAATPKSFVESAQLVALQQGIFKKNGLDVTIMQLRSDVALLRALLSGQVDVASIGSYAVINAVERGAAIRAFVTPVPEQPHMLVTKSSIKGWRDLAGKSFAISAPGAISELFPRIILTQMGVNPDDVTWVAIGGNGARQRALLAGKVDATLIHVERAIQVAENPKFHVIDSTGDHLKGVPLVWHTASTKWLKDNSDVARRYAASIIEAVRFAIDHKGPMLALGKELIGNNSKAVEAAYERYRTKVWGPNGGLNKEDFAHMVSLGLKTKQLSRPIKFDQVVDTGPVDAALANLGRR